MSFLDRERSVAPPGFNRWLVPPAALAVHLSIGQIYAYSVFNKPLTEHGGWNLFWVTVIFELAIAVLGAAAAIFGKWVDRVGPRRTMFTAACFFAGGFLVAALGVATRQLWLIYLGNGLLGGIGLGLAYIAPVSTLIQWFPDRPGVATGMAIMGFGGGALIASPLSVLLMNTFGNGVPANGITGTLLVLGALYFLLMMFGAFTIRVPRPGWLPAGYTPGSANAAGHGMITSGEVAADTARRTPQFWLLLAALFLNVTAGIGILSQASVMIQEMFPGGAGRAGVTAAAAAGFVGVLSLFNMGGRFFWSSLSDRIGRKTTYAVFFALGAVLYFLMPLTNRLGSVPLFVLCAAIILSMYGGGFATMPAYVRDLFGARDVGIIYGRVLLAWSAAAILGPSLVNALRESQISAGVAPAQAYNLTMYIMVGLLALGFLCNLLVRPVNPRYHLQPGETPPLPGATRPSGD